MTSPVQADLDLVERHVASALGCIAMRSIVDKWHVTTCIPNLTIGTTVGVFVLWGFSNSLAPLYIFFLIYSFFAGSFTSAWPRSMRDVTKKRDTADPSIVFACLAAGRGLGNVASGPLSEALINFFPWHGEAGIAYGSGYRILIVFTGITTLLGGSSILGKRLGWV